MGLSMKKYLLFVLFVVALCFITACSSSETESKMNLGDNIINAISLNTHNDAGKHYYVLKGVPVLMYHSIGVEKGNPIIMPKEQFESHIKYIKENGYNAITLNQLYKLLNEEIELIDKPIVITFDDGYLDNYTEAFPILKKHNMPATIFVITSFVDKNPHYLTSQQIKEMDDAGIAIESHTVTHRELNTLTYEEQLIELKNSKEFLEKIIGRTINYIAYPVGKYNSDTIKAAQMAGYKMGFCSKPGWSQKPDGIFSLDRVYISTFYSMDVFYDRINNHEYKLF